MTSCIKKYERALKKELRCGITAKKRLLEQFSTTLATFTEENPAPDTQALHNAFGPPAEMAKTLMVDTTEQERKAYIRNKRICRGVAIGCVALLLAFTIYVFFIKENPITQINGIIDKGTLPSPSASE